MHNEISNPGFKEYDQALHLLRRAHTCGFEGNIKTLTHSDHPQFKVYIVFFMWPEDWIMEDVEEFVNEMMEGFEEC